MARHKRQPEAFDVVDFLRPTDTDLRSALTSLLHGQAPMSGTAVSPEKSISDPGSNLTPPPNLTPPININEARQSALSKAKLDPGLTLTPGPYIKDDAAAPLETCSSAAGINLGPGISLSDPASNPVISTPGLNLPPPVDIIATIRRRTFPIREAKLAQDGHTRAEQQVYEALWERAKPLDDQSRLITIGFAAMGKIARLSESNARINLRSLIQKLAIKEHSTYNCEQSLGRTYRVFNYTEILRRRKEAGLTWYMRKTLAVLFVDPQTGEPRHQKAQRTNTGPGINLIPPSPVKLTPEAGPNLIGEPGPNLGPLYRESCLENSSRESSSSELALLSEQLSQYGTADDDAVQRLLKSCRTQVADCTVQEISHFVHQKANLALRTRVANLIGFLITAVPKCFAGESFAAYRADQRQKEERATAQKRREEEELDQWRKEQEALLADPVVSEEDKAWVRKILGTGN